MKKTVLLLLATLTMACLFAGCEEEDGFPEGEQLGGYYISGDKLVNVEDGSFIKYSPRDIKDIPEFLHPWICEEAEADFFSWFGSIIWTGILDGKRYYAYHNPVSSQAYGFLYTEAGESFQTNDYENWTDIEVIYIHPKYLEYCNKNKKLLLILVP